MFFQIDPANGLAIYDQVVRQMKFAIANAAVRPGEMVPSVRQLARQLAINPNTVARAYRELQNEGILELVRGTGLKVASGAAKECKSERRQLVRERLESVFGEAAQSGLAKTELKRLVDDELKTFK